MSIAIFASILVYLNILRNSILASNTVFLILLWLLLAPFLIGIFSIGYVSVLWRDIEKDQYFITAFVILFVLSWMLAALLFDVIKVKAATTILNAIFGTVLTIAFLTTLDTNFSKLVFDQSIIEAGVKEGISENSLIELFVKIITFPYVLSAIWAQVNIELRQLGIIRR